MNIFSKPFIMAAFERAAKTAAQAAILAILGSGALSEAQVNAFSVNWTAVAGFAIGGFVLSVLSSAASNHFGKWSGPSLVDEAVMVEEWDIEDE